jgi:carboxypeptidase Taq
MPAYEKLMEKYGETSILGSTVMLIAWDMETYMPPGAVSMRGDQMGLLRRITHRMLTGKELGNLIRECESESGSYDEVQSRNLYLVKRDRDIATSVPEDLVAKYTKQTAIARDAWARARNAKDWRVFLPELEKMTELSIEVAEATMEAKGAKTVFDSMIDDCERGMTNEQVAELLTGLRTALVPLVDKFSEAFEDVDASCLQKPVPMEAQREVVKDVVNLLGYDTVSEKARGRFDDTIHPFTSGYLDDVRIALRFSDTGLFDSILGAMHEAGHALYEQNVNHDWMYQPVSDGASMGVHESCSRFAENMIGTSRSFWSFYLPRFKKLTGTAYSDMTLDALMKAVNKVQRSKIRTKSDEVTYCIHIAIRFEIERALFSGKVKVSELPQMWNDLYDRYLHVDIEDDVEGVMQDVHWSSGQFGYFQSYALGNVYDGMYVKRLEKDMPGWQQEVEAGKPQEVLGWLREKVHRWGSLYDPGDLVERAVGEPLSSRPFVDYLGRKYETILH